MKSIDLFSGLGGTTTGMRKAGIDVVWTANHNPVACDYHERNHPGIPVACQDLHQVDPGVIPAHDLLGGSACCQGHSRARGKDKPHHDASRATAFAFVTVAEYHRPPLLFLENVPEFMEWELFSHWEGMLKTLGYSLSYYVRDAADHGIPQNRVRLYVVGTRSRNPIELAFEDKPHVPISSVIDFNVGKWSLINKKGRAEATLSRVANGRRDLGTDRFVAPYYKSGSGLTGRSIDRPLGTVTTKDRWAVIDGDRMRMFTVDEYRKAMSFPDDTQLPAKKEDAVHLLGNATCPEKVCDILTLLQKAA